MKPSDSRERRAEYREKNRERLRQQARERYAATGGDAYSRKYREENRETIRRKGRERYAAGGVQRAAAWREANREKVRKQNRDRLRKERDARGARIVSPPAKKGKRIRLPIYRGCLKLRGLMHRAGPFQLRLLAFIQTQLNALRSSAQAVDRMEAERLGVPFAANGAQSFRGTVSISLERSERRGYLLRQNVFGSPETGQPRRDKSEPHGVTTHVMLLPPGEVIATQALADKRTLKRLRRWSQLTPFERTDVIAELIRWRHTRERTNLGRDVKALARATKKSTHPAKAVPKILQLGEVMPQAVRNREKKRIREAKRRLQTKNADTPFAAKV